MSFYSCNNLAQANENLIHRSTSLHKNMERIGHGSLLFLGETQGTYSTILEMILTRNRTIHVLHSKEVSCITFNYKSDFIAIAKLLLHPSTIFLKNQTQHVQLISPSRSSRIQPCVGLLSNLLYSYWGQP